MRQRNAGLQTPQRAQPRKRQPPGDLPGRCVPHRSPRQFESQRLTPSQLMFVPVTQKVAVLRRRSEPPGTLA